MCLGDCFTPIKIYLRNGQVFKDTFYCNLNVIEREGNDIEFYGIDVSNEELKNLIKDLEIPKGLENFPSTIGQPDARDQGGLFLQVKKGSSLYSCTIDVDSIPKELSKFIEDLSLIARKAPEVPTTCRGGLIDLELEVKRMKDSLMRIYKKP